MGKKGTKRKTRWRILPIGGEDGCNGVCSNNEDEADGDRDSASPPNSSSTISTSYARASSQQRMPRPKPTNPSSRGGSYNYRHRSYCQPHDNQPLVTTEKKMFNEEEYTKITTPRQDVLFKKGYLGRKRPTAAPATDSTANVNSSSSSINPDNTAADIANGNYNVNGTGEQCEEPLETDHMTSSDMMSPMEEQPQYIYATNGYVDHTGGPPPPVYYINGSGYEFYDPYSGNVTVVVGPAPHFGGPGGAPPVLAAVPCQPLPLQPFEWFNPTFLPYVTAPCHNGLASARDRRKRYSTDSQNCSPQSSESTEPPGSPQDCEMELAHTGEPPAPALYTQAPAYVYPGYMFGPPMYNVNGVTVQGAPTQLPVCDISGSSKRRKKKKKKRKRRRGGAEDGCSEESSSDEKELEDPMSLTSQESSSQEIESDSKQCVTPNNDSSTSSPLSSCQTVTPTDPVDDTTRKATASCEHSSQLNEFDSDAPPLVNVEQSSLGEQESVSSPSASEQDVKGTALDHYKCDPESVVQGGGNKSLQELSQQSVQVTKENCEDQNSGQCLKDQIRSEEVDSLSSVYVSTLNSVQQKEFLQLSGNCQDTLCGLASSQSADNNKFEKASEINGLHSSLTRLHSSESTNQEAEIDVQCNSECIIKTDDSTKPIKHKKSGKQANVKHKKSPKGKEEKQKRLKTSNTNCSADTNLERRSKKKGDAKEGSDSNEIVRDSVASTLHSSVNSIPSENITETATATGDSGSSQKNITEESFTVLNRLGDGFHISESEVKNNSLVAMDGSEDKSASPANDQVSSEEFVNSGKSSHTHRTGKHDLFPEFKSCCEDPPVRPLRKEKLQSSPVHSLSVDQIPSELSIKSNITAKPLNLPTISLRPDIPKMEPKCMHEVSSSQLKDSADILDSITAALTTVPPLTELPQGTVHNDNPVLPEAVYIANALHSSKSSVIQEGQANTASSLSTVQDSCSKVGEKLSDLQKGISNQAFAVSIEHETGTNRKEYSFEKLQPSSSTSSQTGNEDENDITNEMVFQDHVSEELTQSERFQNDFEPPIPPPRVKKLRGCKHKLTEHSQVQGLDLEGGNATDESSGGSTTSSTTRESEESVIELLSSTHTNPDDRLKQNLSSDEEEEIIFRAKVAHKKSEMVDVKSVPPDKSNSPSISGPCLQNSKHISWKDKPTTCRTFSSLQTGDISLQYSEMYADELSKIIVSEAVSESSKKQTCLPITVAVTRWLRSQSPDVLALPQPEDDMDSEGSSGEQESDESMADVTGKQQLTGQKNVFCNPLPVPSLEDRHCLLVNTDANYIGDSNGTGRRVALNDSQYFKLQNGNLVSENDDNNRTNVDVSIEGDKRLISGYDDRSFIISQKHNCDSITPIENSDPEKHKCPCPRTKSHEEESVLTGFSWNVTTNVNCKNQYGSCSGNISEVIPTQFSHKNSGMNTARNKLQKEIALTSVQENSFQNISHGTYKTFKSSSEPVNLYPNYVSQGECRADENGFYGKQPENVNDKEYSVSNYKSDLLQEYDVSSCTSEGTLECEWDLWDCNPVKILPVLTTPNSQTPVEETCETPVDYCSRMCDPTVSVAKYYSLGALQKHSVKSDEDEISDDSTDSSDEEVDALKHFRHELKDDDGLQITHLSSDDTGDSHKMSGEGHKRNVTYGNSDFYKAHYGESGKLRNLGVQFQEESDRCRNMYNTTLSQRAQAAHLFHRKSSVLVSKLKGDGPFPCGGICCILQ